MLEIKAGITDINITQIEVGRECCGMEGFPLHIALKLPAMQALYVAICLIADIILRINPSSNAVVEIRRKVWNLRKSKTM